MTKKLAYFAPYITLNLDFDKTKRCNRKIINKSGSDHVNEKTKEETKKQSAAVNSVHDGGSYERAKIKNYDKMVKQLSPQSHYFVNCFKAFWVGGVVCTIAQFVQYIFLTYFDFTKENVGSPTSAVMILLAVILTSFGIYDKISQYAGAGSAVPITGFANSMASSALEYKSEGFVLGVGGNMFKVAGPVIVYGAVSAFILVLLRIFVVWLLGMTA